MYNCNYIWRNKNARKLQKIMDIINRKGITKVQLREMAKISTATLTKLNKNEYVALEVLTRICKVLKCDIGDIVEVDNVI